MAVLKITLETKDVGAATGQASYSVRIATWTLDSVSQMDGNRNTAAGTTDLTAAADIRDYLTARGKTWASEDPVNVIS